MILPNPSRYEVSLGDGSLAAADSARQLAARVLSAEQITTWNEGGVSGDAPESHGLPRFPVVGSRGSRFYVIDSAIYNIILERDDGSCRPYCVGMAAHVGMVPMWDLFVAQKLLLENDEARFWRLARG